MIKTYVGIPSLNTLETGVLYESNSRKGKLTLICTENPPCLAPNPQPPPPPKKVKRLHNHCLRFLLGCLYTQEKLETIVL